MKRIILALIILVFLILDWLALDDITIGNELSYLGEYSMLVVSLVIFLGMAIYVIRTKVAKDN